MKYESLRTMGRLSLRGCRGLSSRITSGLINRATLFTESVSIGEEWTIKGMLHIRNWGEMTIGPRVTINSSIAHNPIGGDSGCWLVTLPGARLRMGADCGISNATIFAATSVSIGDRVLIGGGSKIYDTDFHPIRAVSRLPGSRCVPTTRPVCVGDDVFIGGHVIVLKGVTIGNGAVIGAGSVVTKDVPAGEVWAGNPAAFVKSLL